MRKEASSYIQMVFTVCCLLLTAPNEGMSCKKMGFYLQGQGHSVGLYNQNMTVSTISFISSKPVSLLQPNSIWWEIIISKEVSSETIGLLCSRSLSQPRLQVSVNVSLNNILWIAEPFVTKPSMVIHHYKPECQVRKMGCYIQGQGHSNWVWVHSKKSWLFLLYVLNCWFLGDQLSLTVHVHKLECLVKRLLWCIHGQGHSEGSELQWMFARTISLIGQT